MKVQEGKNIFSKDKYLNGQKKSRIEIVVSTNQRFLSDSSNQDYSPNEMGKYKSLFDIYKQCLKWLMTDNCKQIKGHFQQL